jgi:putative methyltransferase (TIGR04325 family)
MPFSRLFLLNIRDGVPMAEIFQGRFKTSDEARLWLRTISYSEGNAYDSERWMARQQLFLDQAKIGGMPRKSNLPILVGATSAQTVIECGGGSGWISKFLGGGINYLNLELPSVADYFQREYENLDGACFLLDSSEIQHLNLEGTTILYCNSSLQYFEDQKVFDGIVDTTNCDFILLDDVLLSNDTSHFTLQEYYGQKLIVFIETHLNLLNRFQQNGYSLIIDIPYEFKIDEAMEFAIFDPLSGESIPILSSRSMLFKKNS